MKLHYDLFHFKRYLLYIFVYVGFFCRLCHSYCRFFIVYVVCITVLCYLLSFFVVFNRLLIIFFCHISIAVLCLPVPIDSIVVHNHS